VRQSDALIIAFDTTSRASFEKVRDIFNNNKASSGISRANEQVTIIVGTKTDLGFERAVPYEEAR